ncbi:hypothetical protein B0T17DRAFT_508227 [Bombardia bombarda]|uniref:Uncharacterized protein n=1 Tax=Bombardia bombarda TaxID=252184 RepID=A0AA40C4M7_9PEZI|nr:hypothetical protein B0T17DRAFT_508227 [Bombardia bombarda]
MLSCCRDQKRSQDVIRTILSAASPARHSTQWALRPRRRFGPGGWVAQFDPMLETDNQYGAWGINAISSLDKSLAPTWKATHRFCLLIVFNGDEGVFWGANARLAVIANSRGSLLLSSLIVTISSSHCHARLAALRQLGIWPFRWVTGDDRHYKEGETTFDKIGVVLQLRTRAKGLSSRDDVLYSPRRSVPTLTHSIIRPSGVSCKADEAFDLELRKVDTHDTRTQLPTSVCASGSGCKNLKQRRRQEEFALLESGAITHLPRGTRPDNLPHWAGPMELQPGKPGLAASSQVASSHRRRMEARTTAVYPSLNGQELLPAACRMLWLPDKSARSCPAVIIEMEAHDGFPASMTEKWANGPLSPFAVRVPCSGGD